MIFENLSWYYFSIAATILFGVSILFYKFPIVKNVSRLTTTFWSLFIQFSLAVLLFHNNFTFSKFDVILFALLWGTAYAALMLLQMYALSHIETNTLFPITTTLSLIISVIAGLIFFKDKLSFLQISGMILIILIVCLFVYTKGKINFSRTVIILGLGIILSSAFSKIIQKFGVNTGDIYNLQIYQYLFGLISVILAIYFIDKTHFSRIHLKQGFKPGIALGVLSFFGGYFILIALSKGPFPLITAIHSLYMVVAAILGWLVFEEKLTKKKILLIGLAIVAIFLVRLG